MEFLKEVDFDQKIHEVTIMVNLSKILKSDLCFCLKDKPRSREFFLIKQQFSVLFLFEKKRFKNPAGLSGCEYFNIPTKYGDFANISKLEN